MLCQADLRLQAAVLSCSRAVMAREWGDSSRCCLGPARQERAGALKWPQRVRLAGNPADLLLFARAALLALTQAHYDYQRVRRWVVVVAQSTSWRRPQLRCGLVTLRRYCLPQAGALQSPAMLCLYRRGSPALIRVVPCGSLLPPLLILVAIYMRWVQTAVAVGRHLPFALRLAAVAMARMVVARCIFLAAQVRKMAAPSPCAAAMA